MDRVLDDWRVDVCAGADVCAERDRDDAAPRAAREAMVPREVWGGKGGGPEGGGTGGDLKIHCTKSLAAHGIFFVLDGNYDYIAIYKPLAPNEPLQLESFLLQHPVHYIHPSPSRAVPPNPCGILPFARAVEIRDSKREKAFI